MDIDCHRTRKCWIKSNWLGHHQLSKSLGSECLQPWTRGMLACNCRHCCCHHQFDPLHPSSTIHIHPSTTTYGCILLCRPSVEGPAPPAAWRLCLPAPRARTSGNPRGHSVGILARTPRPAPRHPLEDHPPRINGQYYPLPFTPPPFQPDQPSSAPTVGACPGAIYPQGGTAQS